MASASHLLCPPAVPRVAAPAAPATACWTADAAWEAIPADARRWFALAVGSLVLAGLLSLAVVLGRLPGLSGLIGDPLFFKRCLVVHVDLALVVWFYAFLAGLAAVRAGRATAPAGAVAFTVAIAGVVAMLAGALVPGAQPVLANYVPVIDHPLFLGGLGAFFVGTLLHLLAALGRQRTRFPGVLPEDAGVGLQAATLAFVLAGATWVATRAALPAGLDVWTRHEFGAWGAGHVLQVANVTAMVAVWLWLLERATGRPVLTRRAAALLFGLLIAPHFAMPLLTARGALDTLYHSGATQLMRWGIFPIVLVTLGLGLRHGWLRRGALPADGVAAVARAGFAASAGLTVMGFCLGACIRSSTTLVPAHYHASLGGVTVAFMAAAYLVCAAIQPRSRGAGPTTHDRFTAARRQLQLFGAGQAVFALGFAIGGAYGLGRKAYAAEQHVRSAGELAGLAVMGVGGLVATVAGVWFLVLVVRAMSAWWRRPARPSGSLYPANP